MKWKKLKEEEFKVGYLDIIKRTFQLPDGKTASFDIKKEGPAVCVLALTRENKVVLVKQFRPGPEKEVIELPGGCIDKGESPDCAIKRELLEETGYAGETKFVSTSLDCAYSTMLRYNFVAMNCRKIQEPRFKKIEFGKVVEMPLKDFRNLLRSGELTDVETGYLCLDFLGLL